MVGLDFYPFSIRRHIRGKKHKTGEIEKKQLNYKKKEEMENAAHKLLKQKFKILVSEILMVGTGFFPFFHAQTHEKKKKTIQERQKRKPTDRSMGEKRNSGVSTRYPKSVERYASYRDGRSGFPLFQFIDT